MALGAKTRNRSLARDWFRLRQLDAVARCGFGDGYLWRGYDFDDPAQFETVQGGGGSTTLRTASAGGTLDVTTGSAATSYILPARIGGATGNLARHHGARTPPCAHSSGDRKENALSRPTPQAAGKLHCRYGL